MSNEFKRFSHRVQIEFIIKALMVSLSLGLLSVGLPLLILKLLQIKIAFWIYIIIGLAVFLITFLICYLFRPNEKRIARRIDKDLNLNQKVETMVEYQNNEGFMLDIQREDTNSKLLDISSKSLKFKFSFVYFIILAISLTVSITAFALPTSTPSEEKKEEEDKKYEDDSYTIQRLRELIDYVKDSNCNKEYKSRACKALEDLIPKIEAATLESEMKESVEATILELNNALTPSNSHKIIYDEVLNKNTDANGIFFASLINELKPEKLNTLTTTIKNELEANLASGIDTLITARLDFKDKLESSVLKDSYGTDELYLAIVEFGKVCGVAAQNLSNGSSSLTDEIKKIEASKNSIIKAMNMQAENTSVCSYVELELRVLFDLLIDETDEPSKEPSIPNTEEPDDSTDTNKGDNEGGFGEGDILYGSDDVIYDPVLDAYVKYGDVLEAYRAQIEKDVMEGILTPEMIEFYREYYKNLTEKEENNNL